MRWRNLDPAQGAGQVEQLQGRHAGDTAEVFGGLVRDADRASVVATPEMQTLFDAQGDAQGYAVALCTRRRNHLALVVAALPGEQERILAAAHQIEAKLLHRLARRT